MEGIGGYFGLELPDCGRFFPHHGGVLLNSGKNALEYVLRSLRAGARRVWLPYFTCDVVLKAFAAAGVPYGFYHVDDRLEPAGVEPGEGEYLLAVNYYGVKDASMRRLAGRYGGRLIVDDAQAFYAEPGDGIPTIYSPRKFFGVPDGGIACGVGAAPEAMEADVSFGRFSHLVKRLDVGAAAGYGDFRADEEALASAPMRGMSRLTRSMLRSVDYGKVKGRRRENFMRLHEALGGTNAFPVPDPDSFECPMTYPYRTPAGKGLKARLIREKVFCPTYWPNVFDWCRPGDAEWRMADETVCLPVDQRYGADEMDFMIGTIRKHKNHAWQESGTDRRERDLRGHSGRD